MTIRTFKSKIDARLALLAWALPFVLLLALATRARLPAPLRWPLLSAMMLGTALVLAVVWRTEYQIGAETLLVRCGPFRWRIPLQEITAVRAGRTVRSGPAMSFERLEIHYGRGRLLVISPADRADFIELLCSRVPALRR